MKRIITLFAVAMLCATPAFAAGKAGDSAGTGKGNQKEITNVTTVDSSKIITYPDGKTDVGVVENKGKKQENVTNVTTVTDGSTIATGSGATTQAGVVENMGNKQENVTNVTTINKSEILNDGQSRTGVVTNQ